MSFVIAAPCIKAKSRPAWAPAQWTASIRERTNRDARKRSSFTPTRTSASIAAHASRFAQWRRSSRTETCLTTGHTSRTSTRITLVTRKEALASR